MTLQLTSCPHLPGGKKDLVKSEKLSLFVLSLDVKQESTEVSLKSFPLVFFPCFNYKLKDRAWMLKWREKNETEVKDPR